MADIKRFALRLKLHKQTDVAVKSCALVLKHILNKKGTIVQGYAMTEFGEKLQYYWVEDDNGTVYDICFEIAKLREPRIADINFTLTKEAPENFEKDDQNQELFKLYLDEPNKFWKSIPRLN